MTIKGIPSVFYETGMEGVEWVVEQETGNDYPPPDLKDGDYVMIIDNETNKVSYEGLMFFNPYLVNLCRLGKFKVSFYPSKGFPEGISPVNWEAFFKNNDKYRIMVKSSDFSEEVLLSLKKKKLMLWKKDYDFEKENCFSESVSMHGVKSKDFFCDEISSRTGFSLAESVIKRGMNAIGKDYLFFILEDEKSIDIDKECIIESSYPFKFEDFLVPEFESNKILKEYAQMIFELKFDKSEELREKIRDLYPRFNHVFKEGVKNLPIQRKKTYSGRVLANDHYLRCVKIPQELALIFL